MLSVGIDFGTSNSSIAVWDGGRPHLLPIDHKARDARVMRSLLYISRDGVVSTGQEAFDLYRSRNTGRQVRLERVWIGEVELTYAEIGTFVRDVFAWVDVDSPGRLFQSLKRFLPDTSFHATDVFGTRYTLEDLLAALARQMLDAAQAELGCKVDAAVVGRPVRFSDDVEKDRAAKKRLAVAWERTGLRHVEFVEEPVAALHHALGDRPGEDGIALVFDFGGGTLDISVARRQGTDIEVLATAGAPVGGDVIDSRIVQARLAERFGSNARYRRTRLPLPAHLFSALRSWQSLVELNARQTLEVIHRACRESDQPERLGDFERLVTMNYGFELFRAAEAAKVELSTAPASVIALEPPAPDVQEALSRPEFEMLIQPQLAEARRCVLKAVASAGVEPDAGTAVVTTGGSSLVPAFRRMLTEVLPRAELQQSDTFTSVAAGLSILGHR